MKLDEVKVKGKVYKFSTGFALMEWLCEELNTDGEVAGVLQYLDDLNLNDKVNLKQLPKLAMLVRGAVICGSNEDLGDLTKWTYANVITATKIFMEFISNLPGQGESDKEITGKVKAAQEAA